MATMVAIICLLVVCPTGSCNCCSDVLKFQVIEQCLLWLLEPDSMYLSAVACLVRSNCFRIVVAFEGNAASCR